MTTAQQSGEPQRDYSSPATWGDVEQVRVSLEARIDTSAAGVETQMAKMETRLESQMARMETRLLRWSAGLAAAAGLAIIGFLVGVLQAVD